MVNGFDKPVEWYESEPVNKIYDFIYNTDYLNTDLVQDTIDESDGINDFKYSLSLRIDRTINELERLGELVKALE